MTTEYVFYKGLNICTEMRKSEYVVQFPARTFQSCFFGKRSRVSSALLTSIYFA